MKLKLTPVTLIGLGAVGFGAWYLFVRKPAGSGVAVPGTSTIAPGGTPANPLARTSPDNNAIGNAASRMAADAAMARAMAAANQPQAQGLYWPYADDT